MCQGDIVSDDKYFPGKQAEKGFSPLSCPPYSQRVYNKEQ